MGASSANSNSKNNAGKTFIVFGKKEFSNLSLSGNYFKFVGAG
ncbi:hypothetical protein [Tychonema bourrellyi]